MFVSMCVHVCPYSEAKLLFQMLPHYYRHLRVHPHTLLTKFYGLHCIKKGTQKVGHMLLCLYVVS